MSMFRHFISYYKPHRRLFAADMICAFIVAVCDLFYPMIAKNMMNDYVPNRNLRLLIVWGVVLLLIYLVKAGLNWFIQYYGHVVGVRMQADMRRDVFKRLQKLPFSFFDEHKTGSIMSRVVNDLMDISELAHHGPEDLFLSLITIIGAFVLLCTINVPLTIIIFIFVPIMVAFSVYIRREMNAAFLLTRQEMAEINANLENSIAGIRVSRSYVSGAHEEKKFQHYNDRFQAARGESYRVMAKFFSTTGFFTDFMYLVVLVAGGLFFFYGKIDAGGFTAYLLYVNMFLNPVRKLINFFEQLQNGATGFQRFEELMAQQEEAEDPNAKELTDVKGAIDFDHVSFQYETGKEDEPGHMVIQDLSLHIDPGRTVALVGPSGGGKSTLSELIPRFYDATSGDILIDGIPIRDYTQESLRAHMSVVAQNTVLFNDTIESNIAMGKPSATHDEIVAAAKVANAHDFIMETPEGYRTNIGDCGSKLSGGQRQRLSIARAVLKNPEILILDEATSALDTESEKLVQDALNALLEGRTSVVIAHRLSTIHNADRIIVVDHGRIAEQGTHAELMARNGIYAKLIEMQSFD